MADSDERPSGSERRAKARRIDGTSTPGGGHAQPPVAATPSPPAPAPARPAAATPAPRASPAPAAGAAAGAAAASAVAAAAAGVTPPPTPAPTRGGHGGGGAASKSSSKASRFKGVSWHKGKWRARISVEGNLLRLGLFDDEEAAADAYDKAARPLGRALNFPKKGERGAAAEAADAAAAKAARVRALDFDPEGVAVVSQDALDAVWPRKSREPDRRCCVDLKDGPCPSTAIKLGDCFLPFCELHAVLNVPGGGGEGGSAWLRVYLCQQCVCFKEDVRGTRCVDCRERDKMKYRDRLAEAKSHVNRSMRSHQAKPAQVAGDAPSAEGAQSGAPPGGGGDERTTCCADGCSADVEMVKGKGYKGYVLPTPVCKHHMTATFTLSVCPRLRFGYCEDCGGTDVAGAVVHDHDHVDGTSKCSVHAGRKAGPQPAQPGEPAGKRCADGSGEPPRGAAACGGVVRLSFVDRDADVFRYADVVRYAVNTGMHTVKVESGDRMVFKLGDEVDVGGERAEWVWVKNAPPPRPREGDKCVAAGCDRHIIKNYARSWLPVCERHNNAVSFPIKSDDSGTLYRCCRGWHCSGRGRVKRVAEFDDSLARGRTALSCKGCINKDKARKGKQRAANVAADAQAAAAVAAGPSSRVPRSREEVDEQNGVLFRVQDQAEREHAAGMAEVGDEVEALAPLWHKRRWVVEEALEKMPPEKAAKVLKLVRLKAKGQ